MHCKILFVYSLDKKKTEIIVDAIMKEPITLTGFYESEGKLLSFPIKGDGRFNITLGILNVYFYQKIIKSQH